MVDRTRGCTEHGARGDQRRDQQRRNAHPEAREAEIIEFAGQMVRGHRSGWRSHLIVVAAVLVEGNEQQRLMPAGRVAGHIVDVVDQLLAERNVIVGMLAVPPGREIRLEPSH
jgi:hypothetical protein